MTSKTQEVLANPTKEFFIDMLTRDIALNDAILDLLDNCLDGVIRTKKIKKIDVKDKKIYEGFEARISINQNEFSIEDNCGGIPLEIAINKAFRMGSKPTDNNGPTVGVYGIGMKRAIFKIGQSAEVISKHKEHFFKVNIDKAWKEDSENWNFPLEMIDQKESEHGTCITIRDLNKNISNLWSTQNTLDSYINELKKDIRSNYSLILQKGFKIYINEDAILADKISVLFSPLDPTCDSKNSKEQAINPYILKKAYDNGVKVSIIMGFYAPIPDDDELDEYVEARRSSSDAGWTVVCNDRVVLYNDKTSITGWGLPGVPRYHNQFIGIRGIVFFESNNPELLPMTTTKRGIDQSSAIYADVRTYMVTALKIFTDYTNKWKGRLKDEKEFSSKAVQIEVNEIGDNEFLKALLHKKRGDDAVIFSPDLPKPRNDSLYSVIRFSELKDNIEFIRNHLYEDSSITIKPSEIGKECFKRVFEQLKSDGGYNE